jgi:hypothetical protein
MSARYRLDFAEFGPEMYEAASPPARSSSSASASRPAATAARPTARPATTPARPTMTRPTTTPARPQTSPTRPTTPSQQAQAGQSSRPGFSFSSFTPYLQQGLDFARFGTQVAQQFTGPAPGGQPAPAPDAGAMAGAPSAAAPQAGQPFAAVEPGDASQPPPETPGGPGGQPVPVPYPQAPPAGVPSQPTAGGDQLTQLLQALQQRQIQPLPGTYGAPFAAPPQAPAPPAGLALLQMILSNPQFQQTMQRAAAYGPAVSRAVGLNVPHAAYPWMPRQTQVPLAAVLNTIARLAGHGMAELNESTPEDDPEVPEYLVSEDGEFVVDPAVADDRAALVTHLFLIDREAQNRAPFAADPTDQPAELDESELFAEDFGFTR